VRIMTETNRIHLVLFGIQNRTFGPCLAANNRILISLMHTTVVARMRASLFAAVACVPASLTAAVCLWLLTPGGCRDGTANDGEVDGGLSSGRGPPGAPPSGAGPPTAAANGTVSPGLAHAAASQTRPQVLHLAVTPFGSAYRVLVPSTCPQ
jgi:hypothetical protein